MRTIWIARHAETTWNLAGRYQGRMESALSALGMSQAFALADRFSHALARGEAIPGRIVSSPLLRCEATARVTGARLGVDVGTDDRLIEIAHGTWDGRYRDEIAANDPQRYRTWREDPARAAFEGGETLRQVAARWSDFARDLATWRDDTLVVTHDAVVRCALVALQGRPLADFWNVPVENGAFALVAQGDDGALALREPCVTTHVSALRADTAAQAL
ncbi:MAG: alpha-ribazole phosphatase [Vulcanimicrobiaceae bacterium]